MDELSASDGARSIVVLLIDDQPFIGAAVRQLLSSEPAIELQCCHEPLDALRVAGQLRPAVILLDLVMPGIDGLALLGSLVANPATTKTPVIVLSGNDDPQTRSAALAHGALDFLVKLPTRDVLIACIKRHATSPFVGPLLTATPRPVEPPPVATSADERTLDHTVLESYRLAAPAGQSDFTSRLIDGFLSEATRLVETLRQALRTSDTQAMMATAHGLRGTSLTIGARRLAALSAQLESHAGRGSAGVVASVLVKELDGELVNVRQALAIERDGTDGR